jgi:NAD(P)H dehydrogenase (quinone)
MSIVITGGSGQLARATADAVIERAGASELIMVTRNPDAIADYAARGVTVRAGDFDDPSSLPAAFEGGDRLLLISADVLGNRIRQHRAAVDAAAAAGVRHAAYTSIVNPSDSNPGVAAAEHRATEEMLRASGMAWTFLRNSIYTEVLIPAGRTAIASGTLLTNEGDGRTSYISRRDCALAAAAMLTSDGHERRAYDITGPEALTADDVAAMLLEVGEERVEAVHVDDAQWVETMVAAVHMPEEVARAYATFGQATRQGYLAVVSTTFQELTGREPRRVIDVLREYRAELVPQPA